MQVFQIEAVCRQGRSDAGHRAGLVLADHITSKVCAGHRPDFDLDRVGPDQPRQQAQVPGDIGDGVALEVGRRHAAEMAVHQSGPISGQ